VKGLRKVAKPKAPKVRKGLDDPAHKARVKQMRCLLAGRRCQITRWAGTYPKVEVTEEFAHVCLYDNGKSDPHHVQKKSQLGPDLGNLVPLCRAGHDEAERLTVEQFKARWGIALPTVAAKLAPR
jgi:hypothetical protein